MQNPNNYLVTAATNVTGNSAAIRSQQWVYSSFMAFFSDSATTGTIQLQFSNDPLGGQLPANFVPTNWMNVPGSQATATVAVGASVAVYPPAGFVAQWLRISYTRTGGAGTYSVTFNALFA